MEKKKLREPQVPVELRFKKKSNIYVDQSLGRKIQGRVEKVLQGIMPGNFPKFDKTYLHIPETK